MRTLATVLKMISVAGQRAAEHLEQIDLGMAPTDFSKKIEAIWNEREAFVSGVQNLVQGLMTMEELIRTLSEKVENHGIRLDTLENDRAVLKRPTKSPLASTSAPKGAIWLEEDTPDASKPSSSD